MIMPIGYRSFLRLISIAGISVIHGTCADAEIVLDPSSATYAFNEFGAPVIGGCHASFSVDGVEYRLGDLDPAGVIDTVTEGTFGRGETMLWRFMDEERSLGFGLELTSYHGRFWHTARGWVENRGDDTVTFNRAVMCETEVTNLGLSGKWDSWRFLHDEVGRIDDLADVLSEPDSREGSRLVICLRGLNGDEMVIGFSVREAWGHTTFARSGDRVTFTASADMDDIDIRPGEKRFTEAVHFGRMPVLEGLEEFCAATGAEVGARTDGLSYAGWCSWYTFNPFADADVSEKRVMAYAEAADTFRQELPLDLMLLDDGYFTLPGDWTSIRPLFPHGMKWLAEQVAGHGLTPGIWVAPSILHEDSKLAAAHPDWIDRDDEGNPRHKQYNWGGLTHALDITDPVVLDHIRDLITTICHDWGYRYLKLDFNIPPGGNRHDRTKTRLQAIRNMYRVIRETAGPEVFMANCAGIPYPPVIGIAQAGRTSGDVIPNWKSVLNGCRVNILRTPFHRRWWINDPDCIMLRQPGMPGIRFASSLTIDELRLHVTTNLLCGGYMLFSDPLEQLPEDRRRMLAQALPAYGTAAHPVDLMLTPEPGIPRIMYLPIEKSWEQYVIAGAFNWSDEPTDLTVDFADIGLDPVAEYHVYEFWSDRYRGVQRGSYLIERQAPHSCELLAIRPVMPGEIQVLSTDLHLFQGALEITDLSRKNTSPFSQAKAELMLELKPPSVRSGKLVLLSDKELHLASWAGTEAELVERRDGLYEVRLSEMEDTVGILLRRR